jgi:hypothetical protein
MGTNVKGYSDKQLLDRVKELDSYQGIPRGYWLLGVQSNEDEFNVFDDKFYLFKDEQFVMVTSGTTNPGASALKDYTKYNKLGAAVIKVDQWSYNLWSPGLHRGKMQALRQVNPVKYYRDGNKDKKSEQSGKVHEGIIYINFHTSSYTRKTGSSNVIGAWSAGCQVCNNFTDYYKIMGLVSNQSFISYCLIKEF